jgi:transcriptional regulator with XRE-family HTH domain
MANVSSTKHSTGFPPYLLSEVALHKREIVADNIRRLIMRRIKLGEFSSIEHFASSTGVPKSLLSRILNLKADPKLSSLEKIATALEVPVEELLREKAR